MTNELQALLAISEQLGDVTAFQHDVRMVLLWTVGVLLWLVVLRVFRPY
jgi:hypothetical protein